MEFFPNKLELALFIYIYIYFYDTNKIIIMTKCNNKKNTSTNSLQIDLLHVSDTTGSHK